MFIFRGNSPSFRGNFRNFRRSAASGPRTDDKCGAMCVMIGPWYHDPSLFFLTLFGVSCRDNFCIFLFWAVPIHRNMEALQASRVTLHQSHQSGLGRG